ncbi:uncharacterized protein B0H18DRAFT_972356 [Fomitopsis serialis]|uniref:uncharacterized protein n=1 Tax=Fomitopsis serialis TaxID=139415 RepID=UPI002007C5C1|nr:uncharacterized protein B0H18DRAFT_972356 [Neoantrodia serialis]KAH9936131.1 hypothetical protein B0H18DRAFT_972356 [Neoantrodia serialis]
MGNTASNPQSHPSHRTQSPIRRGSPARSPSNHRVHRSLRQKKRSLELPDLASLALTPASSSPSSVSPHGAYRRPTSPIPIPISAPVQQNFGPQNNLPSAARLALNNARNGSRYDRSYMNVYPSTRSFMSRLQEHSPPREELPRTEFVPEIVHSTLPLALVKAEEELSNPEPVQVKIVYRGSGQSVILTRAGDDNWQGRQPMQFDSTSGQWFTYVNLLPGTHHLKFIVDDQIRTSEDYPQAADDRDGSLANYVSVPFPSSNASPSTTAIATTPASFTISPLASPHHQHPANVNSFWSDASSTAGDVNGSGRECANPEWTTEIPPELIAAAAEEESYLALQETASQSHDMSSNSSASGFSSVPTPNIPPAPVLPRHLDKLILNVKPQAVSGSPVPTERERSRRSGRDRSKRERDRESRTRSNHLGMCMTASDMNGDVHDGGMHGPSPLGLPVVTASGTDVTSATVAAADGVERANRVAVKLDVAGLADDASVLPVPSHVVLHHLSTSAIKNGVLAVANTTRYRKKVSVPLPWIRAWSGERCTMGYVSCLRYLTSHLTLSDLHIPLLTPELRVFAVYNDDLLQADMKAASGPYTPRAPIIHSQTFSIEFP